MCVDARSKSPSFWFIAGKKRKERWWFWLLRWPMSGCVNSSRCSWLHSLKQGKSQASPRFMDIVNLLWRLRIWLFQAMRIQHAATLSLLLLSHIARSFTSKYNIPIYHLRCLEEAIFLQICCYHLHLFCSANIQLSSVLHEHYNLAPTPPFSFLGLQTTVSMADSKAISMLVSLRKGHS